MNYKDAQGVSRTAYGWGHLGANWRQKSEGGNNYAAGSATVWVTSDEDPHSKNLVPFDEIYAGCMVGGWTGGNGGALFRNVASAKWGFQKRHVDGLRNVATITRRYKIQGQEFRPKNKESVPLWSWSRAIAVKKRIAD